MNYQTVNTIKSSPASIIEKQYLNLIISFILNHYFNLLFNLINVKQYHYAILDKFK